VDDELTDAAPLLASRLVEPCLNVVLPALLEVAVGDNVVVLHFVALRLLFLPTYASAHERSRRPNEKISWNEDTCSSTIRGATIPSNCSHKAQI
jgi:hypothetical protein